MSTDGRYLVDYRSPDGYTPSLRVSTGSVNLPLPGEVVEAWAPGRGPMRVRVGAKLASNRIWTYYSYTLEP